MKRLVGAVLVALCASMPSVGAAPDDAVRGPGCLDLSADNVGASHDAGTVIADPTGTLPPVVVEPSTNTVSADLSIAKAGCAGATYTLTVVADEGGDDRESVTIVGDGTTTSWRGVTVTIEDDDDTVCVSAQSADANGRVADLLPDSGCVDVGGAAGGIGMR